MLYCSSAMKYSQGGMRELIDAQITVYNIIGVFVLVVRYISQQKGNKGEHRQTAFKLSHTATLLSTNTASYSTLAVY